MKTPDVITLEIPDAEGELHAYQLSLGFEGELKRQDTGNAYRVHQNPDGGWKCSCDSYKHSQSPKKCKHTEALELHMGEPDLAEIEKQLAAPFEKDEVKFKPIATSKDGTKALASAYVDARVIMDRLDDVFGIDGWQDVYEFLDGGSVLCKLSCRFGRDWVTKMDVGGQSEQPDEGDRHKAAVSDALKRAAVKFGVGRYLYRLPQTWCPYNKERRQFVQTPVLPGPKPVPQQPAPAETKHQLPANGSELKSRLDAYEKTLVKEGLCKAGELLQHVHEHLKSFGPDWSKWPTQAVRQAADEVKVFELNRRAANGKQAVATK